MKINKLSWSSRRGQIDPISLAVIVATIIILGTVGYASYRGYQRYQEARTAAETKQAADIAARIANPESTNDGTKVQGVSGLVDPLGHLNQGIQSQSDLTDFFLHPIETAKDLINSATHGFENLVGSGIETGWNLGGSAWNGTKSLVRSGYNGFVNLFFAPLPIAPIEPKCEPIPRNCISFCEFGGDLKNCREVHDDCSVTLSTEGTSCLPDTKTATPTPVPTPTAPAPTPPPMIPYCSSFSVCQKIRDAADPKLYDYEIPEYQKCRSEYYAHPDRKRFVSGECQ